jgi:site-specific recombinase XerD
MCAKMPVVEVAALMGHEDISTTQIYCHVDPKTVEANYRQAIAG